MNSNNSSFVSINQAIGDITVLEILELYKHDTDLLKYIMMAKAEEEKRRGAEEIRRTEEARLQSKFIDLQLDQNRRSSSIVEDTSQGFSSTEWLSFPNSSQIPLPFVNNTPPSPTLSPYTLFDVPFDNLNLSSPSSPEPISKQPKEQNGSCKRTFSRTRSTRKPLALSKKNRSSQIHPQEEEPNLSHNKVIEALRAKLQRSTQQPKQEKHEEMSMSPSGILLLDLKNPKKIFPLRNPRTSACQSKKG